MTTETPSTMTIEDFVQTPAFQELTARMQTWVRARIALGTGLGATKELYGDSITESVAAMMTGQLESNPKIRTALATYYQKTPRQIFLDDVAYVVRHAEGVALVRALSLMASVAGFTEAESPETEAETPAASKYRFAVGDIAVMNGVQYRVTAVNADGSVSEADTL